jgi:hypothetical protein
MEEEEDEDILKTSCIVNAQGRYVRALTFSEFFCRRWRKTG